MPRSAFQTLGITEGDVVEITGKRATAAIAMAAYDEDQSLDVVRLDGLQRGNAEVGSGEHVKIAVGQSRPATRVVFAPAQREMRLQGPAQALKRNFFRKPLVAGDLAVFRTAGAYGATMASSYNSRGFVAETLVDGDRYAVVADRIAASAIMDAERVPEWLD